MSDVAAISNPQLKERSKIRLDATRESYDAVSAAAAQVRAEYLAFNQSLRDHALFLGHDFNPAAVADLREDVAVLSTRSVELSHRFDSCLVAARVYVDRAALAGGEPAPDRVESVRGRR